LSPRTYFTAATSLRVDELPHLTFGVEGARQVRTFPDKLPIGVTGDGRTHVFLYGVTREVAIEFRTFLQRHAELFRALPEWEIRLLVPRHVAVAAPRFEAVARDELGASAAPGCDLGTALVLRAAAAGRTR